MLVSVRTVVSFNIEHHYRDAKEDEKEAAIPQ